LRLAPDQKTALHLVFLNFALLGFNDFVNQLDLIRGQEF
jgi:hypothetical protein